MAEQLCEICGQHPVDEDDPFCPLCRVEIEAASQIIHDPIELLLSTHLPMRLPDGRTMCLCHSDEGDGLFDGPAYHRRHVAELIYDALRLPPPVPWTPAVLGTED